jgi:vacuolar-type H+-ATPase subunit I/STV1
MKPNTLDPATVVVLFFGFFFSLSLLVLAVLL